MITKGGVRLFDEVERDVGSIRLSRWGRVVPTEGVVPWLVVDPDGVPVEPVCRFLVDFVARDNRPGSVRNYAYDLLRWWRWLRAVGVEWDKATPVKARDLVLWLKQARKPRWPPRTKSASTVGTVNPITRKQYLDDEYQPRTVRHSNAVLRSFYEFWIERGAGPLINPIRSTAEVGGRMRTTTRSSRSGLKAASATTRKSRSAGRGRCQTSVGKTCSALCGRTGPGDPGHGDQQWRTRVRASRRS